MVMVRREVYKRKTDMLVTGGTDLCKSNMTVTVGTDLCKSNMGARLGQTYVSPI